MKKSLKKVACIVFVGFFLSGCISSIKIPCGTAFCQIDLYPPSELGIGLEAKKQPESSKGEAKSAAEASVLPKDSE